jgi:hypothetical protein
MKSTAAFWQLGVAAALGAGTPNLALGQSPRILVPFIGIGGSGALISYGSIQDIAQSKSNWGFGAEAGLSWWIGERIGVRGAGGFARHGRAQVASCNDFLGACAQPVLDPAWCCGQAAPSRDKAEHTSSAIGPRLESELG